MADDDVAAERGRLEVIAWGAGIPAGDAARARVALRRLADAGDRPAEDTTAARDSAAWTAGPGRSGGATSATTRAAPPTGPAPDDGAGGPGGRPEDVGAVTGDDGGAPRLPAGGEVPRTWVARLVGPGRRRAWTVVGAAAAVAVAFAAGTVVGTARQEPVAAPSITPTAGTVTLEELLDAPQTYADQLPGDVRAPVSVRSTRLVFTNRALDGGTFATPWSVWAGVGTDRSTICLVATADRIESTSACYPRQEALHGSVSLSAQSRSGTLTLTLRGGGVQGTVTDES